MVQRLIFQIPTLIVLGSLFYYMIKKKTRISYILFFSSLLSFVLANAAQVLVTGGQLPRRLGVFSTLNVLSTLLHFVYAITFCFFIKEVLQPTEKEYEFLEDSRNEDAKY
jgi:predicted PurR-regulated permease PerM